MSLFPVKLFAVGLGGKWPILFWTQYITPAAISQVFDVMEMWWMGWWARQYILTDPKDVSTG